MQRHNLFANFFGLKTLFLCLLFGVSAKNAHPFFVSVTEIRADDTKKQFQVSTRMFIDDVQDALYKKYGYKAELAGAKDPSADARLFQYITERLQITVDGKTVALQWVGFEIEEEAIWCYLEPGAFPGTGPTQIQNRLLYDFIPEQINLIHYYRNGTRNSHKLSNPDSWVGF